MFSTIPSLYPKPTHQSLSSAPTRTNLLVIGDMEEDERRISGQWLGKCPRTRISAAVEPENVFSGSYSLKYGGNKKCFLFRPIGPACGAQRVTDPIQYGDTIHVRLMVKVAAANKVFQIYTGHYDVSKPRKWGTPKDDSYMVSRTLIANANEWTTVETTFKVGDDWTFKDEVLTPAKCNHYHIRFRLMGSAAYWYLDDVKMNKIPELANVGVPRSGFFTNNNFALDHQYWKYSSVATTLRRDEDLKKDVMIMTRGKRLNQDVLATAKPLTKYQFSFMAKLSNMASVDVRIMIRLKFLNDDLKNGVCGRKACNFFVSPLKRTIHRGDGGWQEIVTEEFEMFGNWTEWSGRPDFLLFQLTTRDMDPDGELAIMGFEDLGDTYTDAPSMSLAPSAGPTNLVQQHIGYVVRYAGEVRTVLKAPFQIDKTGEVLDMEGNTEYQLCEVDEVEGRMAPSVSCFDVKTHLP